MDPCPYIRILVGNISIKSPSVPPPSRSSSATGIHPSSPSPCFCKIRLHKLPSQTADVSLLGNHRSSDLSTTTTTLSLAAVFDLSKADLSRFSSKPLLFHNRNKPILKLSFYAGSSTSSGSNHGGGSSGSLKHGRPFGKLSLPLDLRSDDDDRPSTLHDGWLPLRSSSDSPAAEAHLTVRSEPDSRFVFEFGGDPECSPQVFQVQGSMRQPVFTCKFALRGQTERSSSSIGPRSWLAAFGSMRERLKERKGWTVTIHDLSGSPVAMASMVTPFVASPGTDRVTKASPGAWLILLPGDNTWKPWGRLDAWRLQGGMADTVGTRFELLSDASVSGSVVLMGESRISASSGGKFVLDRIGTASPPGPPSQPKMRRTRSATSSPGCSPRSVSMSRRFSGHFGHILCPIFGYKGFVMSSTVEGEGRSSKPTVEIGARNVECTEDAAAFIALAAAVDLTMDACRLFSRKLRKELSMHRDLRR